MNPSAPGWIKKHLPYFLEHTLHLIEDEDVLYMRFRESGFIYGSSINTLGDAESAQLKWTEQEKTKINLFDALIVTHFETIENATSQSALESIRTFYGLLSEKNEGYSLSISPRTNTYEALERIIHERIQTNEPFLQKTFSHLITNALLYIDVLAYDHYLLTGSTPLEYVKTLEAVITNVVWIALQQKEDKDAYDGLLIKLFESSLRYNTKLQNEAQSIDEIPLDIFSQHLEHLYILDLACLAIWDDHQVDMQEYTFITRLGTTLQLEPKTITEAALHIHTFIKAHFTEIAFLQHSNPVQHFYNQTSKTVSNLIIRNKSRLIKELSQSKDLVVLLGQSTTRDLNERERKLVKTQLIDICKSIPSLAIFILPGGGILLPLLMKFIPKLLPSAFNENYD